MEWFRKAANQGHAKAHFSIGCLYHYGDGVAVDKAHAAEWFRKAAELGDADAIVNVGVCLQARDDAGTRRRVAHAGRREHRMRAMHAQPDRPPSASQAHTRAQRSVQTGLGIDRNFASALEWCACACSPRDMGRRPRPAGVAPPHGGLPRGGMGSRATRYRAVHGIPHGTVSRTT